MAIKSLMSEGFGGQGLQVVLNKARAPLAVLTILTRNILRYLAAISFIFEGVLIDGIIAVIASVAWLALLVSKEKRNHKPGRTMRGILPSLVDGSL